VKTPPELLARGAGGSFSFSETTATNADIVVKAEPYPSESEGQEGKSGGRGGSPGLLRAEIVAIDPTIQGRGK
jgi:hypothetical protein